MLSCIHDKTSADEASHKSNCELFMMSTDDIIQKKPTTDGFLEILTQIL